MVLNFLPQDMVGRPWKIGNITIFWLLACWSWRHNSGAEELSGSCPVKDFQPNRGCPLRWRHNERDCVSNRQPHDCLPKRLFRHKSKKTWKLRVFGLCEGNSPVTGEFPAQRASYAENVFICWRHHDGFSGTPGFESRPLQRKTTSLLLLGKHYLVPAHNQNLPTNMYTCVCEVSSFISLAITPVPTNRDLATHEIVSELHPHWYR